MNYYNEFDKDAAAWIRQLIADGLIPAGDVDERSIKEVQPDELRGYTQCHFFAGIAGWPLALQLAGWPNDRPVWTGSCPCQPFSSAGKGRGVDDERHLWPVFRELIRACKPAIAFGEQVASKAGREWLSGVFSDLEGMGYQRAGADLCAAGVGAPHIRQRLFWVAYAGGVQCSEQHATDMQRGRQNSTKQIGVGGSNSGLAYAERRATERHGSELDAAATGVQGEARQRERIWDHAGHGGSAGGLGDTGWQRVMFQCECDPDGDGWCRIRDIDPNECDCIGPTQDDCEYQERDGILYGRRMGHTIGAGLEGHAGDVADGNQPGRIRAEAMRPVATAGRNSWSDFDIIPCGDGKARRIECRTPPLVDGLPRGLVPSSYQGLEINAKETAEARVMRLKGYGNAINPHVAAEFIAAFMDCI